MGPNIHALRQWMFCAGMLILPAFDLFAQGPSEPAPQVNSVVRSADYRYGYGPSPGSLFTIFGSGLASSNASAPGLPLPTILNGVKVTIWLGTLRAEATLYYVSPTQINGVLPSQLAVNQNYSLQVDVNGAPSGVSSFWVWPSAFVPFSRERGLSVAQNVASDGATEWNQFAQPARPGSVLTLWGSGLGGEPASRVTVHLGGVEVKPFFAGPGPSPGVDQISFVLPPGVPNRCLMPVVVQTPGGVSPAVTVAIAPTGACTPELGLSRALLSRLEEGKTIRGAVLQFLSETHGETTEQSLAAWRGEYDAVTLSLLSDPVGPRSCRDTSYTISMPRFNSEANAPEIAHLAEKGVGTVDPPWVRVEGTVGTNQSCSWRMDSLRSGVVWSKGAACRAASFLFQAPIVPAARFGMSGALPAPRSSPPHDFRVNVNGSNATATWKTFSLSPGDRTLVTARSSRFLGSGTFGFVMYSTQFCRAAADSGGLNFSLSGLLSGLPDPSSFALKVATVEDRVTLPDPEGSSLPWADFVLVRIENSATTPATQP